MRTVTRRKRTNGSNTVRPPYPRACTVTYMLLRSGTRMTASPLPFVCAARCHSRTVALRMRVLRFPSMTVTMSFAGRRVARCRTMRRRRCGMVDRPAAATGDEQDDKRNP